jgi:hypothetical protein
MSTESLTKTLEARIDELESRAQIGALAAGYCRGVDQRDDEFFIALWHPDASYLIPGGRGDFHNTDGIRQSLVVIGKAWRSTKHWTTNHVIEFTSEDVATGRSDCFAVCEHHDGKVSFVSATYDDVYERREDGAWRFAKRLVTRWWVTPGEDITLAAPF